MIETHHEEHAWEIIFEPDIVGKLLVVVTGSGNITKLTKDMIARSRVIAKGHRIRDLPKLVEKYGGNPSKWAKKSSPTFEMGGDLYEYHWYEHHGIGRFEIKRKKVSEL